MYCPLWCGDVFVDKKGFAGVFDQGTNVSTESLSKQPAFGAVVSPRISGCTDTKTKNRLVVL